MGKGTYYSVGVGPGDPELMTIKAVKIIESCDVIIAPDSGAKENLALTIAAEHIAGKPVKLCKMPMSRDMDNLCEYHDDAAKMVAELLDDGKNAAFLTLGDPSIYSTAMYIHKRLCARGYDTVIIPAVPSFCAAAAAINESLCEGAQALHIIPASYGGSFSELSGTKVFMKSGKSLGGLIDDLSKDAESVKIVQRASMKDEKVFLSTEDFTGDVDYFSIVVVKEL